MSSHRHWSHTSVEMISHVAIQVASVSAQAGFLYLLFSSEPSHRQFRWRTTSVRLIFYMIYIGHCILTLKCSRFIHYSLHVREEEVKEEREKRECVCVCQNYKQARAQGYGIKFISTEVWVEIAV